MTNVVLSTRNIDDFISDVANEVVKKMELWNNKTTTSTQQPGKYMTRKEAAESLRITLPTLLKWTLEGRVKGYRIGRRILYKKNEIYEATKLISVNQKTR